MKSLIEEFHWRNGYRLRRFKILSPQYNPSSNPRWLELGFYTRKERNFLRDNSDDTPLCLLCVPLYVQF